MFQKEYTQTYSRMELVCLGNTGLRGAGGKGALRGDSGGEIREQG